MSSIVVEREAVVGKRRLKQHERIHGKRNGAVLTRRRRGDEACAKAVADEMEGERALPGREVQERVEEAFAKAGL